MGSGCRLTPTSDTHIYQGLWEGPVGNHTFLIGYCDGSTTEEKTWSHIEDLTGQACVDEQHGNRGLEVTGEMVHEAHIAYGACDGCPGIAKTPVAKHRQTARATATLCARSTTIAATTSMPYVKHPPVPATAETKPRSEIVSATTCARNTTIAATITRTSANSPGSFPSRPSPLSKNASKICSPLPGFPTLTEYRVEREIPGQGVGG